MGYGYQNAKKFIRIEWDWNLEDDDYWEPHEVVPELLKWAKTQLLTDLLVHEDDWMEFVGGMSMFSDKVERFDLTYNPCSGATLILYKHICQCCGKTCGWAERFCDGKGNSLHKCKYCGHDASHCAKDCPAEVKRLGRQKA